MDARRAGIIIASAGTLLLATLFVVEPLPGTIYELASGDATRAVVAYSPMVFYDAQNDTTLAAFGYWNHESTGDALEFRGDVRTLLDAYGAVVWIVEPEDGEPVTRLRSDVSLNDRTGTRYPAGDPERAAGLYTLSPPMVLRPAWPVLAAYAVGIASVGAGAALALGARWTTLTAPAATVAAWVLVRESDLLAVLAAVLLVPVALVTALVVARRRPGAAWAGALAASAFVAFVWVAGHFTPLGGGEL